MTAEVAPFKPETVGEGYRFDPDDVLECAKGHDFVTLVIIGEYEDGTQYIAGNANAGETVIAMERAKHNIIFGDSE